VPVSVPVSGNKMEIKNYRDLIVWQRSMKLVKDVYQFTASFPKEEIYCLTQQIRRSSISVPSNIAEGAGKRSTKDYMRFLEMSSGSLAELETQMMIASELQYIDKNMLERLLNESSEIGKMINGLINALDKKATAEKVILINSQKTKTGTDTATNTSTND